MQRRLSGKVKCFSNCFTALLFTESDRERSSETVNIMTKLYGLMET